jgi:hypothetical protein
LYDARRSPRVYIDFARGAGCPSLLSRESFRLFVADAGESLAGKASELASKNTSTMIHDPVWQEKD